MSAPITADETGENDVRGLLSIVVSYDNRRPSNANITAWHEQAVRCRWTFDEAREAIHTHFAQSAEFLMPAHVTALIRAKRRQPGAVDEVLELDGAPPANPERVKAIVERLSQNLGWVDPDAAGTPADRVALEVNCPYCQALPGRPCTRLATRGPHQGEHQPLSTFHASRSELAAEEDATETNGVRGADHRLNGEPT